MSKLISAPVPCAPPPPQVVVEMNDYVPDSKPDPTGNVIVVPHDPTKKTPIASVLVSFTADDESIRSIYGVCAADVVVKPVHWLWLDRIPLGKITLFSGAPGQLKSTAAMDVAARVSTGRVWPDGRPNTLGPRGVLYFASEDDAADTLVPRLICAGADLKNVIIIKRSTVKAKADANEISGPVSLVTDKLALNELLKQHPDVALVVFDVLISYLGKADSNSDKDVRPLMDALKDIAEKRDIAILAIIHTNKKVGLAAVSRVSGSVSLAGGAREAWNFSRDKEDKTLFRMSLIKGNLNESCSGMTFTKESVPMVIQGESVSQVRIVWGERFEGDADDVLAMEKDAEESRTLVSDKASTILATFDFSRPVPIKDVYERAEAQGISSDKIKRAKAKMGGLKAEKFGTTWCWYRLDSAAEARAADRKAAQEAAIKDTSDLD